MLPPIDWMAPMPDRPDDDLRPGFRRARRAILAAALRHASLVLIDRTEGTNFGDMDSFNAVDVAFDGDTTQTVLQSAVSGTATGYVGKTLAAPRVFGRAVVYGSSNSGYGGGDNDVTVAVYGKNGAAPASATDGKKLGEITFADAADESAGRTINSSDRANPWDHLWARVAVASGNAILAELELYAWE